jgi:hypothetical protein
MSSKTFEFQRGLDWVRRFSWQQDGVPVMLRLAGARAYLRGQGVEIPADEVVYDQYVGVVDVVFRVDTTLNVRPGTYTLQVVLEFLNGVTQGTDCYQAVVTDCGNSEGTVSWA